MGTFDATLSPVSPGAVLEAGDGACSRVGRAVPVPVGTRVQVEEAGPDGTLYVVRLTRLTGRPARIAGAWGVPVRFGIPVSERAHWRLIRLVPL